MSTFDPYRSCTHDDDMKSPTLRILSIGGMLATATALTINSHVLSGTPASASVSSSSTPTSTPVTASSAPIPGAPTQLSYRAGDAATLILDSAGGTLRVVTFAPHPGWFTVRLEQPSATNLEVRLESTAGQVRFAASLANGVVVTELDVSAGPNNSTPQQHPGNSTPGNSTPGNSTPGTAPGNSTPGGDDHGGDDNGGSGGGGSDDPSGGSGHG